MDGKGRNHIIPICIKYLKYPEDTNKYLLDLINIFSKLAGFKINIQK
jgi:hypothetical protein